MRFRTLSLVVFAIAVMLPASALATPFQVDISMVPNPTFDVTFSGSGVSLASANQYLGGLTGPGEFEYSAPIYVEQVPGGPLQQAVFEMNVLNATTGTLSGGNFSGQFGPGSFDIDLLTGDPTNPLTPWLSASFASSTLALANIGDPQTASGSFSAAAIFSGPSFVQSGLQNPGYFVFGLGDEALSADGSAGTITASYLTVGFSDGSVPVPEPATLSLLAFGLAGMGLQRRRTRRAGKARAL